LISPAGQSARKNLPVRTNVALLLCAESGWGGGIKSPRNTTGDNKSCHPCSRELKPVIRSEQIEARGQVGYSLINERLCDENPSLIDQGKIENFTILCSHEV
jgi:hypothetical protein